LLCSAMKYPQLILVALLFIALLLQIIVPLIKYLKQREDYFYRPFTSGHICYNLIRVHDMQKKGERPAGKIIKKQKGRGE
jgi:hypothetical protein